MTIFAHKFSATLIAGLTTFSIASAAHATDLDFTSIGAGSNGKSFWSTTVDGVVVTVTPGVQSGSAVTKLYWDSADGFGVNGGGAGYEHDEIDSNEKLTVNFSDVNSKAISVDLLSFSVSDLFYEAYNWGSGKYNEIGYYQVGGGAAVAFNPTSTVAGKTNGNGEGTILVGASTSVLVLTAPGYMGAKKNGVYKEDHEFSLAGLSFRMPVPTAVSVPELSANGLGSSLLLLGGLGLVVGGRRRRSSVAAT